MQPAMICEFAGVRSLYILNLVAGGVGVDWMREVAIAMSALRGWGEMW